MIDQFNRNTELLSDPEWLYAVDGLPRGRIAIRIDASGRWFHNNEEIKRAELVRLLEAFLVLIDERIYLRAPEQLLAISVDDCPFTLCDFSISHAGDPARQMLTVTTATGITRQVDHEHGLEMWPLPATDAPNQQFSPKVFTPVVHLRKGLYARFNRASYYRLLSTVLESDDGQEPGIYSSGQRFVLTAG